MPNAWTRRLAESLAHEWRLVSSGQRWTAALGLGLCVVLLGFGLPSPLGVGNGPGGGRPAAASPLASQPSARAAAPSSAVPVLPGDDSLLAAPTAEPISSPGGASAPSVGHRPDVVLLAAPPGPVPGPSDADVARAFRDAAGLQADLVVIDPATDAACALGLQPGTLVVTSFGLGPVARRCLLDAGVIVLGYDAGGETGPTPTGGWDLSTSRGDVESLLDLARWGRATGRLSGKVGVVASAQVAAPVGEAVSRMKALGIDVVATVVLDDGPASEAQVTAGARDFATAGVETVILAATADHQRSWALRAALLAPNVQHLVSDLAGALLDEARPPTFAGSLAHTALRLPWFSRDHGATPAQQRCTATWTAGAPGTPALAPAEEHRVFAWCQHVQLVVTALAAAGNVVDAIRKADFDSPLTSTLGPQPDGTWSPGLDAVLTYDAACACWTESAPFAPRPPEDR